MSARDARWFLVVWVQSLTISNLSIEKLRGANIPAREARRFPAFWAQVSGRNMENPRENQRFGVGSGTVSQAEVRSSEVKSLKYL